MGNVASSADQSICLLTRISIVRTQVLVNPRTICPHNLADNLPLKYGRQLRHIITVGSRYHNRERYAPSVAEGMTGRPIFFPDPPG